MAVCAWSVANWERAVAVWLGVLVRVGVSVLVGVRVGVRVDVAVLVAVGRRKPVPVGGKVEEGSNTSPPSVGVHGSGNLRNVVVDVAICTEGGATGGWKGFRLPVGLL